jgi:GNAT superfamily N-acetyltransferase
LDKPIWQKINIPKTGGVTIREAGPDDTPVLLDFIRGLADYEGLSSQFEASEELLRKSLFIDKRAEALIASCDGVDTSAVDAGFALFFYNYSTFTGKPGIYIEDLFVKPELRGKGAGRALMRRIAQIAVSKGCGRLEWSCLNWNTPSINFYKSCGARELSEWTGFRLSGPGLEALAR